MSVTVLREHPAERRVIPREDQRRLEPPELPIGLRACALQQPSHAGRVASAPARQDLCIERVVLRRSSPRPVGRRWRSTRRGRRLVRRSHPVEADRAIDDGEVKADLGAIRGQWKRPHDTRDASPVRSGGGRPRGGRAELDADRAGRFPRARSEGARDLLAIESREITRASRGSVALLRQGRRRPQQQEQWDRAQGSHASKIARFGPD